MFGRFLTETSSPSGASTVRPEELANQPLQPTGLQSRLNSCVSRVCDVLGAGGANVPPAQGSAQVRFLLYLEKAADER